MSKWCVVPPVFHVLCLGSIDNLTRRVEDVQNILSRQDVVGAQRVLAGSLVCTRGERAQLVEAVIAYGIEDIPQLVVVANPGVTAGGARANEIHGVGCSEGELTRGRLDQVATVLGWDEVGVGGETTAGLDVALDRRVTSLEVVQGVEGDIVRAAGLVDLQQSDRTTVGSDLDADLVAVDRGGPVGDPIDIDLTAKHAD